MLGIVELTSDFRERGVVELAGAASFILTLSFARSECRIALPIDLSIGIGQIVVGHALGRVYVEAIVEQEVIENDTSAAIQERIDAIAEDTEAMQQEYKTALQNIRQLKVYNRQLESLIHTQEAEVVSVRRQIDDITVVGRQVLPHMERILRKVKLVESRSKKKKTA